MDRTFELEMVDDLLEMMTRRDVELVDDVHEEPVENYTDPARFDLERRRLFQQMPIIAALSPELPEPGSWKTFDDTGVPIVLVRGEDGVVRGFHNTCGHRGARLVEEPRGQARRWSCPFHAWTYNIDGTLGAITAKTAFPGVCPEDRGLHPVEVREHLGVVWLLTTPTAEPMDLDAHLGPFAAELARWDLGSLHYFDTKVHVVPANWKLTWDTFTEAYHVGVLHKDSAGVFVYGNNTLWKPFGDHHRQMFALKSLEEMRELPPEQRNAWDDMHFMFTYLIYPNTSFLFARDHAEMFQTFPGPTVDRSVCVHSYYSTDPIATEDDRTHCAMQFDFYFNLVETEDFRIADGVQRNLRSGSFPTQIFGRYEPITQAMHRAYQRDLDADAFGRGDRLGVTALSAAAGS